MEAGVFYPIAGFSGLFVPIAAYPPLLGAIARVMPFTYVVSLLLGIWRGEGCAAHWGDVVALVVTFVVGLVISSRVFRWSDDLRPLLGAAGVVIRHP